MIFTYSSALMIWSNKTKETYCASGTSFKTEDLPITLWVEGYENSGAIAADYIYSGQNGSERKRCGVSR